LFRSAPRASAPAIPRSSAGAAGSPRVEIAQRRQRVAVSLLLAKSSWWLVSRPAGSDRKAGGAYPAPRDPSARLGRYQPEPPIRTTEPMAIDRHDSIATGVCDSNLFSPLGCAVGLGVSTAMHGQYGEPRCAVRSRHHEGSTRSRERLFQREIGGTLTGRDGGDPAVYLLHHVIRLEFGHPFPRLNLKIKLQRPNTSPSLDLRRCPHGPNPREFC
jgi:hypothetical protein